MATKTKTEIAQQIADEAVSAGATAEMIAAWDLLPGDCDLVRAEYPDDTYPSDAISSDEWRAVMCDVEAAVREIGQVMLAVR